MYWLGVFILSIMLVSSCGRQVVQSQLQNSAPDHQNPLHIIGHANQLYQKSQYQKALKVYGIIYYDYSDSREYIDAALGMAKCYGAMGYQKKKFNLLYDLLCQNIIPSKIPLIYNTIAEFYLENADISRQISIQDTSDYQAALKYFQQSIDYPSHRELNSKSFAQFQIATIQQKLKKPEKAIIFYQKTIADYPGTAWALKAAENIRSIQGLKKDSSSSALPNSINENSSFQ